MVAFKRQIVIYTNYIRFMAQNLLSFSYILQHIQQQVDVIQFSGVRTSWGCSPPSNTDSSVLLGGEQSW